MKSLILMLVLSCMLFGCAGYYPQKIVQMPQQTTRTKKNLAGHTVNIVVSGYENGGRDVLYTIISSYFRDLGMKVTNSYSYDYRIQVDMSYPGTVDDAVTGRLDKIAQYLLYIFSATIIPMTYDDPYSFQMSIFHNGNEFYSGRYSDKTVWVKGLIAGPLMLMPSFYKDPYEPLARNTLAKHLIEIEEQGGFE